MKNKYRHLEMIQGIISRMASNSFLLKGWSVIVVSALFALAAKDANSSFVYLAFFPALAFWILDGYFLRQEKLFRALYDHVRGLAEEKIDFSMDVSAVKEKVVSWFKSATSITLSIFHGVICVSILIVIIIISI
ncbi:MAG: hypothetical protein P9L96_01345 [Candidatus Gygaella obscura]|nr:hypothetical protein [Candidatus Gygaella obscura]